MPDAERHILVSIVIPTYNRRESLCRTLYSLFQQDFPMSDFEIVVVIDGSTDGTEEMLCSLEPPCALRWFVQENQGASAACNRGVEEARGELIVFVDDDNLAAPQLIREHTSSHADNPNKAVLGAVLLAD